MIRAETGLEREWEVRRELISLIFAGSGGRGDNKSFWFGLIFRWGKCEQVYELRVKILVQMVGWGGQI